MPGYAGHVCTAARATSTVSLESMYVDILAWTSGERMPSRFSSERLTAEVPVPSPRRRVLRGSQGCGHRVHPELRTSPARAKVEGQRWKAP